jgi:hypothetical protein
MKNGYSDVYSKMDLTKYTLVAMKCVNGIDPLHYSYSSVNKYKYKLNATGSIL